jgi:hypothetical protein
MPVLEKRILRHYGSSLPKVTMRKGKLVKRATAHELLMTIELVYS